MDFWLLSYVLLSLLLLRIDAKPKKGYGKPKPTKAPTVPEPVAEPVPLAAPIPDYCFGKKDGNYAVEKCSSKYVSCVGYSSIKRECHGGLVFDSVHNDCTHKSKSVDCTGQPRSVTPAPTEAPVAAEPSVSEFNCGGLQDGLYENPAKQCDSIYYACTGGRSSRLKCSGNLLFDPDLHICDVHANVPACSGLPRTTHAPIIPFVPVAAEPAVQPAIPVLPPVDFDCSALEDGYYGKGCAGVYYACVGQQAHMRECPVHFVYDALTDQCEQREFVAACGGQTRAPVLPESVIEKVPSSVFDCSSFEDGFYTNPQSKCSATYYACSGGLAEKLQCPEGLAYEPESLSCEPVDTAFVCTGVRKVAAEATLAPTPGPTFPPVAFNCGGRDDGPYPSDSCSNLFFICSNGIATSEQCAADSIFDDEKKACNLFVNVFACTGLPPPTEAPFVAEEPQIPESADYDCRQLSEGLYPNDKEACSQQYYVCSNGISFLRSCIDDLYFDAEIKACQVREFVFACSGQRPTTYAPVEQELYVNTPAPVKQQLFDCSDLPDGSYPNPSQACSNFYHVCSNKQDDLVYCGQDTYYDPDSKVCARFVEVPICSGLPPSEPDVPAGLPSDFAVLPPVPFDCSGKTDGDYSNPTEPCSGLYYSCVDQQARSHECPAANLFFDDKLDLCAPKEEVSACGGSPKVLEPPAEQPQPQAEPEPEPQAEPSTIAPKPTQKPRPKPPVQKKPKQYARKPRAAGFYRFPPPLPEEQPILPPKPVRRPIGRKHKTTPTPLEELTTRRRPIRIFRPIVFTTKPTVPPPPPTQRTFRPLLYRPKPTLPAAVEQEPPTIRPRPTPRPTPKRTLPPKPKPTTPAPEPIIPTTARPVYAPRIVKPHQQIGIIKPKTGPIAPQEDDAEIGSTPLADDIEEPDIVAADEVADEVEEAADEEAEDE